jgi:hypothetical protein
MLQLLAKFIPFLNEVMIVVIVMNCMFYELYLITIVANIYFFTPKYAKSNGCIFIFHLNYTFVAQCNYLNLIILIIEAEGNVSHFHSIVFSSFSRYCLK